jgi:hypothetical protein
MARPCFILPVEPPRRWILADAKPSAAKVVEGTINEARELVRSVSALRMLLMLVLAMHVLTPALTLTPPPVHGVSRLISRPLPMPLLMPS